MSVSKTSNAYGFKEISKSSNNIKSLHEQRHDEGRKEDSNGNVAKQTADEILQIVKNHLESVPTAIEDATEVKDFSDHRQTQITYLKLLEAYLSNQLLQVKNKIEALWQEELS